MKMNCTACSEPIDKTKGYYLVMGAPYCTNCYQPSEGDQKIWAPPLGVETENLLEAFRAYQKRSRVSACRNC